MSIIDNEMAKGFEEAIRIAGVTFKIAGKEYQGVQAEDIEATLPDVGGMFDQAAFALHCRKSDFPTFPDSPASGTEVTIGDEVYRVLRIATSAGDPCLRLDCADLHQ